MFLKKILSILLISIIILNISFFSFKVYAISNIDIVWFKLNNITNNSYFLTPWEKFNLYLEWQNKLSENIDNIFLNIDFTDNSNFSYDWTNHKSYTYDPWDIDNPVPSSAYDSNLWFQYNLTYDNEIDTWMFGSSKASLRFNSSSAWWFQVSQNISDYTQDISVFFTWAKVSDWSEIVWETQTKTIYVNVKPYIVDYYFEKSDGSETTNQIQWSEAEAINLVLAVKDYNGHWNIDGWTITADLSQLWLWSSENLTYDSLSWDLAIFKKTWITTLVSTWTYNFNDSHFTAIDEDGNINDSSELNFDNENKTTNLPLSVVAADAPSVHLVSEPDYYIWWVDETSTSFSFSWSQIWEYAVSLDSDGSCIWWTSLTWWTAYDSADSEISYTINSSSLNEWNNSIFACVKNGDGNIWSITFDITKDTSLPSVNDFSLSPANVTSENSSVSFTCSEDWEYKVVINTWSTIILQDWSSVTKNTETTVTIPNSDLSLWENEIEAFCKDKASNVFSKTWNITKQEITPSMVWSITSFSDIDDDYEWLDGRDIKVTWDTTTWELFNWFESYRIYILPSSTSLDTSIHDYVRLISDEVLEALYELKV